MKPQINKPSVVNGMNSHDVHTAVNHNGESIQSNVAITPLFSREPSKAIVQMQEIVKTMALSCNTEQFIATIKGNRYPKVEWWTTIAATLGLFPVTVYSKRLDREGEIAYEARVEVRHGNTTVAAGEALCSDKETQWRGKPEYSIKSMAITRATGKAYRIPLSFLAVMAGLSPTPAEEMNVTGTDVQETPKRNELPPTDRQLQTLHNLLLDNRLTEQEKVRLSKWLENPTNRIDAGGILDYFFGESEYKDGEWIKTSDGVLADR